MKNIVLTTATLLLIILVLLPQAKAQKKPNITLVQEKNVTFEKGEKDYYEVSLKAEPFTLHFEGKELLVSAGLEEDLFENTRSGVDINKDYGSNFYIFKYAAGAPDTDYLIVDGESANALNVSHGVLPAGKKKSLFTVKSLFREGKPEPLSNFEQFFMALWLDKNKDQFIDQEEIIWVKVNIVK